MSRSYQGHEGRGFHTGSDLSRSRAGLPRIRLPRSQFYAHALEAYVRVRSGEDITERLNEVYAKKSSKLDTATEALSLEVLRREKW